MEKKSKADHPPCVTEGCEKPASAKAGGWCVNCGQWWRYHRDQETKELHRYRDRVNLAHTRLSFIYGRNRRRMLRLVKRRAA